jgi:pyrophosphatase PpaX
MKQFDAVIFDVDGTLTSTNNLIFETFRFVAKKYLNKNLSNQEIISLFGPPEDVILKEWYGDKFEEVKDDYYSFYRKNHHMADLYPGIIDILKFLHQQKVLLSIYTGKGREAATITLKTLHVYDYFDLIITGDDVKEHKPAAEGILLFTDKYNLDKEKVLMIGDSIGDIKAARSAGVKIASVVWDSYGKDEVIEMGADYIFHTVEELKDFIHSTCS